MKETEEESAPRRAFNLFPLLAVLGAAAIFVYQQDLVPDFLKTDEYPAETLPKVHRIEFASPLTDARYQLFIQVPHRYFNSDKRYPVFYVLNGRPAIFFHDQLVLPLLREEKIPEAIFVGIDRTRSAGFFRTTTRTLDHTFLEETAGFEKTGGADDFLSFLRDNVIPFIDATYRTIPGDRGLGGHSLEALFVMYVALTEPELFNYYHASSPSLFRADFAILELEEEIAGRRNDLPISLYLSVGELEYPSHVRGWEAMSDALAAREYPNFRFKSELHPQLDQAAVAIPAAHSGLTFIYHTHD